MANPVPAELFDHVGPWTEREFLALPVDHRLELLDGELLVSPSASHRHQRASFRLATALDAAVPPGYEVLEAINVRVGPGRILIPDIAVIVDRGRPDDEVVSDAADVAVVVEIVSPGGVVADRAVKPQLYAGAGIPLYLRVELGPDAPSAVVYQLADGHYAPAAGAEPGGRLVLPAPFAVEIDLDRLVARR